MLGPQTALWRLSGRIFPYFLTFDFYFSLLVPAGGKLSTSFSLVQQPRNEFALGKHLAMSGDIFDCHNSRGDEEGCDTENWWLLNIAQCKVLSECRAQNRLWWMPLAASRISAFSQLQVVGSPSLPAPFQSICFYRLGEVFWSHLLSPSTLIFMESPLNTQ